MISLTKNVNLTRSTVRDHLVATRAAVPQRLIFKTETLATKILLCKNSAGQPQAYGVQTAAGPHLLPVQGKFTGPSNLTLTQITAKYEVIVSAGRHPTSLSYYPIPDSSP